MRNPAHIIFLMLMITPVLMAGQDKDGYQKADSHFHAKLSPELKRTGKVLNAHKETTGLYLIQIKDSTAFYNYQRQYFSAVKIVKAPLSHFIIISCTYGRLLELIKQDFVNFADRAFLSPATEGYVISHDFSVNAIHATQQNYPDDNGKGEVISLKEDRMDTADIDIVQRFISTGVESRIGSTHATSMTTLIAGAGNSSFRGKGVAVKSFYASSDFAGALPDASQVYNSSGIKIQNHSYGIGIQNYYGANARAFDLSVRDNPELTHVFSSGNSGTLSAADGIYVGVKSFANLTGNMKMAKNVLVVGAIDSNGIIPDASSRGPAYDGRLKPDLVAFAEDGSSGSAALVSGAAAVLQDVYRKKFATGAMSDIVRAVLINAAEDVGNPGPDFLAGFGNMNLFNAVLTIKDNRIFRSQIIPFSEQEFLITVPPNAANLKITLVWNDPPATPLAGKALINNLDLTLEHKESSQIFLPWVLNFYPDKDSLLLPAKPGRDTINNTEQLTVSTPLAGEYILRVKSGFLQGGNQAFALAWQYDSIGKFDWMYPAVHANLEAGRSQSVRWKAVFPPFTKGKLEWSADSLHWHLINGGTDVNSLNERWNIPDTISMAWMRMTIGTDQFVSVQFVINPISNVRVGYVCDSTLLYWDNPLKHNLWRLYQFHGNEMTLVRETADTAVTLLSDSRSYFALAPVIDGVEGIRGPAQNISQSGVGCYISNFLTDLIDDKEVSIRVSLGTVYGIKEFVIEKPGNVVKQIFKTNTNITDSYELTDRDLNQGINRYRIKITLSNGRVIYSSVNIIYYTAAKIFLVFPVPALRGTPVRILQKEARDFSVEVSDATGRRISHYFFQDTVNEIRTDLLNGGLYLLKIKDEQGKVYLHKIVIL